MVGVQGVVGSRRWVGRVVASRGGWVGVVGV